MFKGSGKSKTLKLIKYEMTIDRDDDIEQLIDLCLNDKVAVASAQIAEMSKFKEEMMYTPAWVLERFKKVNIKTPEIPLTSSKSRIFLIISIFNLFF